MKEAFPSASETAKFVDPIEAEMMVKEKQVAEAREMLAQAGLSRERFPDLYLALEEAMDEIEEGVRNARARHDAN